MSDKELVFYIFNLYLNPKYTNHIEDLISSKIDFGVKDIYELSKEDCIRTYIDLLRKTIHKIITIYGNRFVRARPNIRFLNYYNTVIRNPHTLQKILKDINEFRTKNWYWKKFRKKNEG